MNFCIAVILTTFVTLVASTDDPINLDKARVYTEECAKEFNISLPDLKEKIKTIHKLPYDNDSTGQCFVKCLSEKSGFYDKDSGFKVDYMYERIGGSKRDTTGQILATIKKCANEADEGANDCERAYRGGQCYFFLFFATEEKENPK